MLRRSTDVIKAWWKIYCPLFYENWDMTKLPSPRSCDDHSSWSHLDIKDDRLTGAAEQRYDSDMHVSPCATARRQSETVDKAWKLPRRNVKCTFLSSSIFFFLRPDFVNQWLAVVKTDSDGCSLVLSTPKWSSGILLVINSSCQLIGQINTLAPLSSVYGGDEKVVNVTIAFSRH